MAEITKGYIGKDDLKIWDGVNSTFSRTSNTGGSTTLDAVDFVGIDVDMVYSGKTNGALDNAISAIGSSDVAFFISNGTWTIAADITIPSNVTLIVPPGSIFSVSNGITLTINGQIQAGLYQIFTGDGDAKFGAGSQERVLPQWWYSGSGDYTTALQAAADAVNNAGGGKIYLVSGTYTTDTVTIYSNTTIEGESWDAILKKTAAGTHILSIAGTGTTVADNQVNITLKNFTMEGLSVDGAYSATKHIVYANGVSDLLISNCKIAEAEGAAVFIGSGVNAGGSPGTERHNERVRVENCLIDGVNNTGYSTIYVVDCDGLWVKDNHFKNCTAETASIAVIELSNSVGGTFSVFRNIHIEGNVFIDCKSAAKRAFIYIRPVSYTPTVTPSGFWICNNTLNDSIVIGEYGGVRFDFKNAPTDGSDSNSIFICGNKLYNLDEPFRLETCKGVTVSENKIYNCKGAYVGGTTATDINHTVDINYNEFHDSGDGTTGMYIYHNNYLKINNNMFNNSNPNAMKFVSGDSTTYIEVCDNTFLNPSGGNMTAGLSIDAGHTLSRLTNKIRDNRYYGITESPLTLVSDITGTIGSDLPDSYPIGITQQIIDGDTDAPDPNNDGTLITIVSATSSGYREWGTQLYFSKDSGSEDAKFYMRKANSGSNTWDTWYTFTGS